jgi:Uma2 family endonuclease
MEGMTTMTESPPVRVPSLFDRDPTVPWTVEELFRLDLPEGYRFEILNGSLLVSPSPSVPHCRVADDLADTLKRQAPSHLRVSGVGFSMSIAGGRSYLIPDVSVMVERASRKQALTLLPPDLLLVIEVLSPSNARNDLLAKRAEYADAGVPHYWIVDPDRKTLTVLTLDSAHESYAETVVVRPGQPWKTEEPFPLTLDLGEIFTT